MQSAKQRFSEVVRAAQAGEPQIITKHGEPVAVVIDIAEYERVRASRPTFVDFLLSAPYLQIELPERTVDVDRAADLFDVGA